MTPAKTIKVELRGCSYEVEQSFGRSNFAMAGESAAVELPYMRRRPAHVRERARELRRLAAYRGVAALDPQVEVQLITGTDGVCRVVARRLGGWGCNCDFHREKRMAGTAAGSGDDDG